MDIVINDGYESIISGAKKIADKTEDIKKDLATIRARLDDYYDGKIDFDSDFKSIEKRLGTQAENMLKLANAIDEAVCGLMDIDGSVTQTVAAAAKKSIADIRLSDTSPKSAAGSIKSFVSNFTAKAYETITSIFTGSSTGTLAGAAALGAISAVISGKQPHTSGSGNSNGGISTDISSADTFPTGYDKYRNAVKKVNDANVPIQVQIYEVDSNGIPVKDDPDPPGRCNVAAMTQLLNNRLALDGKKESFTPEDVFLANGCTIHQKVTAPKGKPKYTIGYEYSGETGYWDDETKKDGSLRLYTNSNGTSYSIEQHTELQSTIKSAAEKGDIDSCKQMLAEELQKHPEGIVVRSNGHAVVFTDYEEVNDKIKFNVQDGLANNGQTHDGDLIDTWFFNNACLQDEKNLFKNITHIVSLK